MAVVVRIDDKGVGVFEIPDDADLSVVTGDGEHPTCPAVAELEAENAILRAQNTAGMQENHALRKQVEALQGKLKLVEQNIRQTFVNLLRTA